MRTDWMVLVAAGTAGLAWASLAAIAIGLARRPPLDAPESLFETRRRERLRAGSFWFRIGEGWVDRLARWNEGYPPAKLKQLDRDLQSAGQLLPLRPEEAIALVQLQSIAIGVILFILIVVAAQSLWVGGLFGGLMGFIYFFIMAGDAARVARKARNRLKDRLPFTVDLMALMMEAGATFPDCLKVAVLENAGHPLGNELALVQGQVDMGRSRREALLEFRDRVPDPDIEDMLFAVVTGEELGTPLSEILRGQADQMRLKRSQRQEKESAEAQVTIVFPGMLIMIACLLLVTVPFLLPVFAGAGSFAF